VKRPTLITLLIVSVFAAGALFRLRAAEPKLETRAVDPSQAGAPKNVALNVDTGSCKGSGFIVGDNQLLFSLNAPDPMPIPFTGCSMKPEFYKDAQLHNGWRIVTAQYDDALVNYAPPPSSSYGWIKQPSGISLYGQVFLSLPACKAKSDPCWKTLARTVSITIQGPGDKNPYRRP
jgi:hypothetical protein